MLIYQSFGFIVDRSWYWYVSLLYLKGRNDMFSYIKFQLRKAIRSWNWQLEPATITPLNTKKHIFQTCIFGYHLSFPGCTLYLGRGPPSPLTVTFSMIIADFQANGMIPIRFHHTISKGEKFSQDAVESWRDITVEVTKDVTNRSRSSLSYFRNSGVVSDSKKHPQTK